MFKKEGYWDVIPQIKNVRIGISFLIENPCDAFAL